MKCEPRLLLYTKNQLQMDQGDLSRALAPWMLEERLGKLLEGVHAV